MQEQQSFSIFGQRPKTAALAKTSYLLLKKDPKDSGTGKELIASSNIFANKKGYLRKEGVSDINIVRPVGGIEIFMKMLHQNSTSTNKNHAQQRIIHNAIHRKPEKRGLHRGIRRQTEKHCSHRGINKESQNSFYSKQYQQSFDGDMRKQNGQNNFYGPNTQTQNSFHCSKFLKQNLCASRQNKQDSPYARLQNDNWGLRQLREDNPHPNNNKVNQVQCSEETYKSHSKPLSSNQYNSNPSKVDHHRNYTEQNASRQTINQNRQVINRSRRQSNRDRQGVIVQKCKRPLTATNKASFGVKSVKSKKSCQANFLQWVSKQNQEHQDKSAILNQIIFESPLLQKVGDRYFEFSLRNRHKDEVKDKPYIYQIKDKMAETKCIRQLRNSKPQLLQRTKMVVRGTHQGPVEKYDKIS